MRNAALSLVLLSLTVPSFASAQEEEETAFIIDSETLKEEKKDSLDWRLISGATFTLQDNQGVVGQQDGTAVGFGFKLDTGIDWRTGDHEWRNSLGVQAGLTRNPAVDRFVKSQDVLDVDSIYLYHINDWFGAFGRFAYNTTMFRGTDVRAEPTNYRVYAQGEDVGDPNQGTPRRGLLTLNLTDPFLPSRFRESLGLFAQPYKREVLNIETRLGGGARQTLADGQLAISDDEERTPDQVDVATLSDVIQVGTELAVELWGSFQEKKITYRLAADAMTPFYNNQAAGSDKSALELTNFNARASLSVKIVEWASLDYEFATIYEPQLVDKVQLRNNLLLTFGFATGSPDKEEEAAAE